MTELPDVDGWDASKQDATTIRFDSTDRRATVLCRRVQTAACETFNCRLYESENPHSMGRPTSSVTAAQAGGIGAAVQHLDSQRQRA